MERALDKLSQRSDWCTVGILATLILWTTADKGPSSPSNISCGPCHVEVLSDGLWTMVASVRVCLSSAHTHQSISTLDVMSSELKPTFPYLFRTATIWTKGSNLAADETWLLLKQNSLSPLSFCFWFMKNLMGIFWHVIIYEREKDNGEGTLYE